jgi:hypothetical protein
MNQPEFNQWWSDFKLRFPDMSGPWFAENRTPEMQRQILGQWAEVLADVDLQEALAVSRGMQCGALEGFGGKWDRDRIPAMVRTHALAKRAPLPNWTGPQDDPFPQPKDTLPMGLGGKLRELVDMQAKGMTREESAEWLRLQFPSKPLSNQRRFRCAMCLDAGRIEVWHSELVHRAKREGIDAAKGCIYRTEAAACTCAAGSVFARRVLPLVQYDVAKHCRAIGGDTQSEAALTNFTEWLADQAAGKNRANYTPEFAEF